MNTYDKVDTVLKFKVPYHPLTGTTVLNNVQPYTNKIIRTYLARLTTRVVQAAMGERSSGFSRAVPTSDGTELHYPYVFTLVSRETGKEMTLGEILRSVRESWSVNADKWKLVATLPEVNDANVTE